MKKALFVLVLTAVMAFSLFAVTGVQAFYVDIPTA
jgi:hypothetical protein